MSTSLLDTRPGESGIILAQNDHAAFARDIALHKTLQLMNGYNQSICLNILEGTGY